MKKTLLITLIFFANSFVFAQLNPIGKTVTFHLKTFKDKAFRATQSNGLVTKMTSKFPLPDGTLGDFIFDETLISTQKIPTVQTYDGVSKDGKVILKLTIMGDKMEGALHSSEGYFFFEPVDISTDSYRVYSITDLPADKNNIYCGYDEKQTIQNNNGRILSISPFPVGTQLRRYVLAAAATGEMTTLYGSQLNALAKIVSIINAANLIYELEASIHFDLATQTTNQTIIFANAATDPFGTIGAEECQRSFTLMHISGVLPYSAYGIGHTFNTLPALGNGSNSANGVAGPKPCEDGSKSRAFTQWTYDASVAFIIAIFAHEVGHQFSAPHTYNAGSPVNCSNAWDSESAVEPGSGSTLMGYGTNCNSPTDYVLTSPNKLNYFHTKSLHQIFTAVNTNNTCITTAATGNTPPVANAGADITIPKGTPFTLNGIATDVNSDAMSYTWDQYDVATANDKGAFGSGTTGVGGYTAVNSTTAPLFRSEQSSSTPSRTFPKLIYIVNDANNPSDNAGEDLPQVARTMKFRFTVRDNKANGGGVDSDEVTVSVANVGPLEVSSFNSAQTITAGSVQTITWNVNGTNSLSANVKIQLSTDGGTTFPFVLQSSTSNDGSESITIPTNVANTTQGRIKVTCEINANSEFFDINNSNITITSSCAVSSTFICSNASVSGNAGDAVFNLGLSYITGNKILSQSKSYTTSGAGSYPIINYTNNTYSTCQASSWGNANAVLVKFRVSKTGSYEVSTGGRTLPFSVFSSATYNCANFVGGNSYEAIGWNASRSITLNECTTYYILVYLVNNASSVTINITGSGDLIEVLNNPAGFNYTYVAVNQSTSQISAVSSTSNFTSLSAGTFTVYGLSYATGFDPNTLLTKTMTQAYALGSCILFSSNYKQLTIIANPCSTLVTLTHPTNDITSGTVTQQASLINGKITASNWVTTSGTKATYQAKSIELNNGFRADNGTVFKAEIGGCN